MFMRLLWSFIVFVVVACTVASIMQKFTDGEENNVTNANSLSKLKGYFAELGPGWAKAVIVGAIIGLINYFAPTVAEMQIFPLFAVIILVGFYLVMAIAMIRLAVWWNNDGISYVEMLPFLFLDGLFILPFEAVAAAIAAVLGLAQDGVMAAVLYFIPVMIAIIVAIAFVFSLRNYERSEIDE